MLAIAPSNFKFSGKVPCAFPLFEDFTSCFCSSGHGKECRSRRRAFMRQSSMKWPKARAAVVVSAGYTRTPMGTAGAYQIIDSDTGEKFIIWGGIGEGDDSRIPPKEVLSWKPNDNESISGGTDTIGVSAGINPVTAVANGDSQARATRPAQNFGRLKAHRVKALVKKASSTKQVINQHDHHKQLVDDTSFCGSVSSPPDPAIIGGKNKDAMRHEGSVSIATKTQETGEAMQIRPSQSHKPNIEVSAPDHSGSRVSVTPSKGWGNVEFVHGSKFKPPNLLKQQRLRSFSSDFFSQKTFKVLGCSDNMIESLREQLFLRPSHIQAMAFAPVAEGRSCIIADQSGSGKTLAYLVPVIQRLRQEELQGLSKSFSKCPRVVILVPTAELACQVLNNCRSMSKFGVPFRSMVATGGFRQRTQLENLEQDVDVLIATPGRLMFLINEGFLQFTNLRCAVLDEVDVLFRDADFELALQKLLNASPVSTQYIFVTATLPIEVFNKVVEVFPDCEAIMGPGMHRISPRLEEVLVDCSGDDEAEKSPATAFLNKKSALLRLVEETQVSKTIVFCNKIETCRKVENALKRFDRRGDFMQVLPFHAALAPELRLANMKSFLNSQPEEASLFLVCTDRASRGIDFANVDRVVLFDFPRDPSEYVRRVGRTARGASGRGKAFIFVVGKQVSLARRIMERNKKGHPLHDVPNMQIT
ncbi:DEAD-box ATP-dependent RNA helicase 50 [Malania oleifera]|uniref:DEAD-box ATP-dependent RNA helicase 50 n=1 Tax=Malania oleifera TaxID=397392 RepID=UPI0025AEA6FA|nr:DEAD-box ATP-dependent RNA helicase 50 [Malania oleifera]